VVAAFVQVTVSAAIFSRRMWVISIRHCGRDDTISQNASADRTALSMTGTRT
jgi:hypothetical protein